MKKVLKNITLQEKINQENKEINEIIGKALRSQSVARKYEDKFKEYGITVDYNQAQGVTLIGPNGKQLEASKYYVGGPSSPSRNGTHKKYDTDYAKRRKEYEDRYNELKAMKRDDIIRKYPNMSSKEALKNHKEDLEYYKERIEANKENEAENRADTKEARRKGHLGDPSTSIWDKELDRPFADSHIDYLTYLTKPSTGDDFRRGKTYGVYKTKKSEWADEDEDWTDPDNWNSYKVNTKNPVSDLSKAPDVAEYSSLKSRVSDAKDEVRQSTYNKNDWYRKEYGAMTDKQLDSRIKDEKKDLDKQIADLKKEYEKKIAEIKKQNVKNKEEKQEAIQDLKNKEKELDDFLKAKGVREAARYYRKTNLKRLEAVLKESTK